MSKYLIDKIEISSDFDREDSDEENSNEENSNEENSDERNWKILSMNFFSIYKNGNITKNTKKSFGKKHVQDIKIFPRKKKTKGKNRLEGDNKIFLKKKNKKSVSIIVNVIAIFLRNKSKSKLNI